MGVWGRGGPKGGLAGDKSLSPPGEVVGLARGVVAE